MTVAAAPSEVVIRTPDDSGLTLLETVEPIAAGAAGDADDSNVPVPAPGGGS